MNRTAVPIAVGGLFLLAGAAWFGGCPPEVCAVRGLIGAAAGYTAARIVIKVATSAAVDAVMGQAASEAAPEQGQQEDRS
jgi:hypothetical protein